MYEKINLCVIFVKLNRQKTRVRDNTHLEGCDLTSHMLSCIHDIRLCYHFYIVPYLNSTMSIWYHVYMEWYYIDMVPYRSRGFITIGADMNCMKCMRKLIFV